MIIHTLLNTRKINIFSKTLFVTTDIADRITVLTGLALLLLLIFKTMLDRLLLITELGTVSNLYWWYVHFSTNVYLYYNQYIFNKLKKEPYVAIQYIFHEYLNQVISFIFWLLTWLSISVTFSWHNIVDIFDCKLTLIYVIFSLNVLQIIIVIFPYQQDKIHWWNRKLETLSQCYNNC